MRWKLKDLLAERVHPVPEKAVHADFRHAKTTRAGTSGKKTKGKKESCNKINENARQKQKL